MKVLESVQERVSVLASELEKELGLVLALVSELVEEKALSQAEELAVAEESVEVWGPQELQWKSLQFESRKDFE